MSDADFEVDMKIAFGEITRKRSCYTIQDSGWLPLDEVTVQSPVVADIVLQQQNEETVALNGTLSGGIILECGRCGEAVEYRLEEDFFYLLTIKEEELIDQQEIECTDEDYSTLYLKEPVIDIGEILREQLFLAIPGKVLCSGECRGICPSCGVNLNRGKCHCEDMPENSPFAVLKALKKK